jgi:general secretion pathway protein G
LEKGIEMDNKKRNNKKGFTLVEVMAVLIIVGLLAGVAVKSFMGQTEKARVIATKANLKVLHEAVQLFQMDVGRYPSEEEGLEALVLEPADAEGWAIEGYLDKTELPKDGWKGEFDYTTDPGNGKPFVVISYGADGEEGGEEGSYDADLWSTDGN